MTQDIVLIPTFWRPEYLHLCLEAATQAAGSDAKQFWIYVDAHLPVAEHEAILPPDFPTHDKVTVEMRKDQSLVLSYWQSRLKNRFRFILRQPHPYYGNSFNTLEAYRDAFSTDAKRVYLVEDDILVKPDFFTWSERAHHAPCFCTVGWSPSGKFLSCGVGWDRERLGAVLKYAEQAYYENPESYVKQHFPASQVHGMAEQDGLIRRIIEQQELPLIVADDSRCEHIGAFGYHKFLSGKPTGDFQTRLEFWRERSKDPRWLQFINQAGTNENQEMQLQ